MRRRCDVCGASFVSIITKKYWDRILNRESIVCPRCLWKYALRFQEIENNKTEGRVSC